MIPELLSLTSETNLKTFSINDLVYERLQKKHWVWTRIDFNKNISIFKSNYIITLFYMLLSTKIIILTIYLIIMVLFYVFMIKRLWFLNKKHVTHTGVKQLNKNHKSLIVIISLTWLISIGISTTLILNI